MKLYRQLGETATLNASIMSAVENLYNKSKSAVLFNGSARD